MDESDRLRKELYKASRQGDVSALIKLIEEDELVLERTITSSSETPLHIAAMLGHVEFANEILSRKPDLAWELDSEGLSPLHLASARNNIEMVRELVRAEPDVCLSTDCDGRTPLHLAAMKGRVEIMEELLRCRPTAIDKVLLNGGETILHLCAKHSRLEALELLLQWVAGHQIKINSKDNHGNTVLHLAVAKKHIQIIKLLLGHDVEVNALNQNGLTALDSLTQSTVRDIKDMEIAETLRGAGGLRATEVVSTGSGRTNDAHVVQVRDYSPGHKITRQRSSSSGRWGKRLNEYEKWLEKKQNTVMVVASLIASIGFQAILNPPTEFSGKPLEDVKDAFAPSPSIKKDYTSDKELYMHANTIGVLGSMLVILLVMSGLPLKRRVFVWVLMFTMCASITAMVLSYFCAIGLMASYSNEFQYIIITWLVLIAGIFLMHTTRFLLWVVENTGRSKRILLWFWCPITVVIRIFPDIDTSSGPRGCHGHLGMPGLGQCGFVAATRLVFDIWSLAFSTHLRFFMSGMTNDAHVVQVRDYSPGHKITRQRTSSSGRWGKRLTEYEKWLEKKQSTVMVVASLIASIGFQAILTPPTEFSGKPLEGREKQHVKDLKALYMHANTIGLAVTWPVVSPHGPRGGPIRICGRYKAGVRHLVVGLFPSVEVGDMCQKMHRSTPAVRGPSSYVLHFQARTSSR
ncbi:hypothetical protein Sjap_011812 [Stephania japonica]|uniref:PGG domain-containing protein n=1 Tax=Stephania japonica TaxID=461633 RepID=A0AAP0JE34_9MAGN